MSIRSIAATAVKRDLAVPGTTLRAPEAAPAAGEAGGAVPDTSELAAALPTEVVGLYTAAIALLQGALGQGAQVTYVPLRWWLYVAGFVLTVVTVELVYGSLSRAAIGAKSRKFPWKELLVALLAFGVWGLVLPGSALYGVVRNPALTVTVGLATLGGTTLVGLLQKYYLTTTTPTLVPIPLPPPTPRTTSGSGASPTPGPQAAPPPPATSTSKKTGGSSAASTPAAPSDPLGVAESPPA